MMEHYIDNPIPSHRALRWLDQFLRANAENIRDWVLQRRTSLIWACVGAIVAGAGVYGAAMGFWRSNLQALYTGIKLPLVILLTTLGNGLLNGMLAPLLGLNITFRQSLVLILVSFAVTALILGALAPVALFVVWNTPPLTGQTSLSSPEYALLQLTLALFLALAGITGTLRLLPLLRQWSTNGQAALRVLLAWLAMNLFLGSQISWVLRPFIWDPADPVGKVLFIGRQYWRGSFYETVFEAVRRLIFQN